MVYGQTGLFFAFFLPSGALLFTAGVWAATGDLPYSVFALVALLIVAAILGHITGYWFGYKAGPLMYRREDSTFFKKRHLSAANTFYHKYGGLALTAAPFFPIIRTFSPIVSGMIKLNIRKFLLFTTAGSVLWITSFVLSGYLVGSIPALKPYLRYVILIIIITVTIPTVIKIVKEFNRAGRAEK